MILSQEQKVNKPGMIAEIMQDILKHEEEIDQQKEHFWVVGLNGANIIQYIELSTLGLVNSSQVHARETFRLAILKGVVSIVVIHNHPSGEITPSDADVDTTKRIKQAGDILGIYVLDHIIIANNKTEYYSFMESGAL